MIRRAVLVAALVVLAGGVPATVGGVPSDAAVTQGECSFPVTMTDATGTEVTVEEEPQRIVTLAPSAAQTVWEIGAQKKVVGVSKYATYLEGAEEKTNVSGGGRSFASVEKVVALEPDLVLAPNVIENDTVEQLRNAGLTVYKFGFATSIEFVYEKTNRTGRLVGACEGARSTVADMQDRIDTVREAVEGEDRPRVLYTFFGFTAGRGTFIHEVIETAGGDNVAANANITGYRQLNPEVVVARNPQWIVLNSDSPTVPKSPAYNNTTAVKEGNIVVLNANYISQPAPRIVQPIVKLAKALHPEAYAAANTTPTPTATVTPTATPTATATETTVTGTTTSTVAETTTATTTGGQPGFGATIAAAALAVAALGLRRRRGR